MASDTCIPIKVALQLMDPSSLGLAGQYEQFQDVHRQLQNALKVIVNEHHQGFNSSIGTFHKIQAAIHASQHRVRSLRAGLVQARGSLATVRPELSVFAGNSQNYDQMLQIVRCIERLQAVPEQLEAQLSEKRFLGAVAILQEALSLIRKPELEGIGALTDLRVYLSNQEHSVTDILIEELHSHLYLKSPYCEERWKSHTKRDSTNAAPTSNDESALFRFLETYDGSKPMQEDASRNPEADTFYYIQLLVESLGKMGKLEVVMDAIEQRLPVELFRVVERSNTEVEQRHPSTMRSAAKNRSAQLGIGVLDSESKATLEDLLTTLYAKFEAIAEGHRVLHDVTAAMLKRESQQNAASLNRSFRELWQLLQSEIRQGLHDHLASNGTLGTHRSNLDSANANIFRPKPRDRSKKLFKLSDTDSKATNLATEREDLEFILKASVPGLVNTSAQHTKKDEHSAGMSPDRSATGHKLLVEPSVFNMGVLLAPSLAFLTRLKEVVPPHSGVTASALTSFLDDFLINVFYPQLDETLMELCGRSTNDLESFQVDPSWQRHSAKPVFRGAVRFYEVIKMVCGMLDALPHEQSFSQLVITQMRTYYDRCYQWSKNLLRRAMAAQDGQATFKMRLAADLATSGDINDAVIQLLQAQAQGDGKESMVLAEKESALLINLIKARRIEEADLINDRKALAALCTLHLSMKWLTARCQSLRYISPRAVDMSNTQSHHNRRWTTNLHLQNAPSSAYLPLDASTATQFDAVLMSLTELSTLILRTLHVDMRLQLLSGIYTALDTSYSLGQPYNDPDPSILALSTSMATYDVAISAHLLPTQYAFLTNSLHVLVNNALCSLVGTVPAMDAYGNSRMQLNVLVLQQSLKNVQSTASLEKAARFYDLAERGAESIVSRGVGEGYMREDLKALLRLCWRAERDGGRVDDFVSRLG